MILPYDKAGPTLKNIDENLRWQSGAQYPWVLRHSEMIIEICGLWTVHLSEETTELSLKACSPCEERII